MGGINRDHVVININKGNQFECRHCGVAEDPGYPLGLGAAIEKGEVFADDHGSCVDSATKTLTFRGHSDDIVNIHTSRKLSDKVVGDSQEHDCFQYGTGIVMATFEIGKRCKVVCLYDGCWSFAVGQVDEKIPLPEWPVAIKGSDGYTSILEIIVPALAELERTDAPAD